MAPTISILNPEKGASLFALCIACIVICTTFLVLRLWSRATLASHKFGADDWSAVAAWPFVVATLALIAYGSRIGFGVHIEKVPLANLASLTKALFSAFVTYDQAIFSIRISAIFFYRRVFGKSSKKFNIICWVSIIINVVWVIIIHFLTIFECRPIAAAWDKSIVPATCSSTLSQQLGSAVTSVCLDLWILVMPLPMLYRLQVPKARKAALVGLFVLGYSVIVFTIGRCVSVFKAGTVLNTDITWAFVTTLYWFTCEITAAFICICLPGILHLMNRLRQHGWGSLFTDAEYSVPYKERNPSRSLYDRHSSTEGGQRTWSDASEEAILERTAGTHELQQMQKGPAATERSYA